jgi:hypothetical protein
MKNKIIALAIAVLMIAAAFTVYIVADKAPALVDATNVELNAENKGDGIFYTLDENTQTATVGKAVYAEHNTSGVSGVDTVTIPDTVSKDGKTYVVREVGRNAFDGSDVREVIILNSVTRIGEMAFADCDKLERVAMGTGVTEIAGFAFWNCAKLVDVSLGANVKSIGGCAFWSCPSLEVITIPQGAATIMEKAFADCANLKVVYKADTTAIAENAFEGIETAPEIKNEYVPALYAPTVYGDEGETVTYRLLLEGNAGGTIPTPFKLNGAERELTGEGVVEIDDRAYNGTIFTFTEPITAEPKTMEVEYNEKTASGSINACDHATTSEVITTAPTCTEKGAKDVVCAKCHKVLSTAEVEALGHDYVDFVIEAVCLDGGYTTHKCSRCGDLYKDAETDPTGHSWGEGTISSMPTHSAKGVKKIVCDTCKRVESIDLPIVGDINGDGKRNAKDVTTLMKYLVGSSTSGEFYVESANCDGKLTDGAIKLNAKDVTALMKALVNPSAILPSTPVPTAPYVK